MQKKEQKSAINSRPAVYLLVALCSLLFSDCSRKLDPEPLALSVKQNLALLQSDAQFVMYFNFNKMRGTQFWEKFISDSLFAAERNFGHFLYMFREATGASITGGIDELYFSNSWIGGNAIVIKGIFDRKKVDEYVDSDTSFTRLSYPGNITVYRNSEVNFNFYFKDEFTVCASNDLKQVENTMQISDTSAAGLLTNGDAMRIIERIKFKDNLWMMSSQKLFIRGIFENFAGIGEEGTNRPPEGEPPDVSDTSSIGAELEGIYGSIEGVSFSIRMTEDLELVMQNECKEEKSAGELKNKIEGIIALAKLSGQFSKKTEGPVQRILDRTQVDRFEGTVVVNVKFNEEQISEIRKQNIF